DSTGLADLFVFAAPGNHRGTNPMTPGRPSTGCGKLDPDKSDGLPSRGFQNRCFSKQKRKVPCETVRTSGRPHPGSGVCIQGKYALWRVRCVQGDVPAGFFCSWRTGRALDTSPCKTVP